ncbi:hypothetical protein F5H01DRAFT_364158 [Linnemannia elongata]|nr:hypothetical protein F5H01DRAFT_364158 [Linnemannia elongata]
MPKDRTAGENINADKTMSLQKIQTLLNEAITLRPLPHTDIVACISHFRFQQPLHLVLELASHNMVKLADLGEMKDKIKKPNSMVVAEGFQEQGLRKLCEFLNDNPNLRLTANNILNEKFSALHMEKLLGKEFLLPPTFDSHPA